MDENLNLIDLISEKHITLRRVVEERWRMNEAEDISHTEALLLAKVSMGKISLAEVGRQANISRQAMYKCAKKLEEKGYLKSVIYDSGNKYMELTNRGIEYCEKSTMLKLSIEEEITKVLGTESTKILKELLKKNWIR